MFLFLPSASKGGKGTCVDKKAALRQGYYDNRWPTVTGYGTSECDIAWRADFFKE